jgi:ferredoxin-type protein NapG
MVDGKDELAHWNRKLKRRLQLLPHQSPPVSRRRFMVQGTALLAASAIPWAMIEAPNVDRDTDRSNLPIRPPGALTTESRFQAACIRCGMCGTVCENGCIQFFGQEEPHWGTATPFLDVRQRSCTLCMRCTQICPSGALSPIDISPEAIRTHVHMGKAVVDPEHCISYLGRLCGFCHDACPIPKEAIHLTPPALPVVLDGCVGCGRCVEYCPQTPTAIRIVRSDS